MMSALSSPVMSARFVAVSSALLTAILQSACSTAGAGKDTGMKSETYPANPIRIALQKTLPSTIWEGTDAAGDMAVGVKQKGKTCFFTLGSRRGSPFRVKDYAVSEVKMKSPMETFKRLAKIPESGGGQAGPLWMIYQGDRAYWFYYDHGVTVRMGDGVIQEFTVLNPSVTASYLTTKWETLAGSSGGTATGAHAGAAVGAKAGVHGIPNPRIVIVAP